MYRLWLILCFSGTTIVLIKLAFFAKTLKLCHKLFFLFLEAFFVAPLFLHIYIVVFGAWVKAQKYFYLGNF